jgi:excisionase family DNA binding protein
MIPAIENAAPLAYLMTSQQVAARFAISIRTLWRLVRDGAIPQPRRFNRKLVRWNSADIDAALTATSLSLTNLGPEQRNP